MKHYTKAALVADALCLGPHWIYNQSEIDKLYPEGVYAFTAPASSYHGSKQAGDLTHTGDQLYFLSQLLEEHGAYGEEAWRVEWVRKMSSYTGYLDGATKTTLASHGAQPSLSDEVAGAARGVPILDLDLSLEDAVKAMRSQASLTHGSVEIHEVAEFFTRAVYAVREGEDFSAAFDKAASDGSYTVLSPETHLEAARNADGQDHLKAASGMGLSCHFPDAFPLILFYALHFSESFPECMSKNALAGGDSTARGIFLSALFVARDGDVGEALSGGLSVLQGTTLKKKSSI